MNIRHWKMGNMLENSLQKSQDKQVVIWLFLVAAVIFLMILLGGTTRLTHSGLSMVDWKPIMGIIPPITELDWQESFTLYQSFPEYQKVNLGMTLEGYQSIFYFEYFHRLLGRLIGLIFLVPFLIFWFRGAIRKSMLPQMITMFILGGLQGVLGWYMVKSGLVNDPQVSQYRLTAHLIAAIAIYSYILWVAFGLVKGINKKIVVADDSLFYPVYYQRSKYLIVLIILMIASGGFVAGTKAGFAFNTFPLMAGQFVPEGMYSLQPFFINWFENITTIQFNHRLIAYLLLILVPIFALSLHHKVKAKGIQRASVLIVLMLLLQVSLGIATLLMHVPVSIAVSHQGGAVLLLSLMIYLSRALDEG